MHSFIIGYFVRKYGARKFIEMLLETYMPTHHLQAYPKPKISEEVMSTRAHI